MEFVFIVRRVGALGVPSDRIIIEADSPDAAWGVWDAVGFSAKYEVMAVSGAFLRGRS